MQDKKPYVAPFIRRAMAGASEEEIVEASENFRAYVRLLFAAFMQQKCAAQLDSRDSEAHGRFPLGGPPPSQ